MFSHIGNYFHKSQQPFSVFCPLISHICNFVNNFWVWHCIEGFFRNRGKTQRVRLRKLDNCALIFEVWIPFDSLAPARPLSAVDIIKKNFSKLWNIAKKFSRSIPSNRRFVAVFVDWNCFTPLPTLCECALIDKDKRFKNLVRVSLQFLRKYYWFRPVHLRRYFLSFTQIW